MSFSKSKTYVRERKETKTTKSKTEVTVFEIFLQSFCSQEERCERNKHMFRKEVSISSLCYQDVEDASEIQLLFLLDLLLVVVL